MLDMANKDILPAMSGFTADLADAAAKKSAAKASCKYEEGTLSEVTAHLDAMYDAVKKLEADEVKGIEITDAVELADFCRDVIIPDMEEVRKHSDAMEMIAAQKAWPYPSYGQLLFGVR